LTQARGDVLFAATDHPELATDAVEYVQHAGSRLLQTDNEERDRRAFRARAFVIRAFGDTTGGAALFAVYRLSGNPASQNGFAMAAVRWTTNDVHIVRDLAGEVAAMRRPWTPRIAN
jgi:hypothetical protein